MKGGTIGRSTLILAGLLLAVAGAVRGDEKDAKQAADNAAADVEIGQVRVLTLKPVTILHTSLETTLQDLHGEIKKILPDLIKAAREAKLPPDSPIVMVYHGVNGDPQTKFSLDVGVVVPKGTPAAGDYKVKDLPEYPCVSVLYSGPVQKMGQAYGKLVPAIGDAGKKPTDESRQMFLYWEGDDSPNNVTQVTMGIEKP